MERHLDVAERAAQIVYARVRGQVPLEELIAMANEGLAEAAQRYEPDRGAAFGTFAWYRVQGAILDGLRRSSNLPRRVWAKLVALRAASEYLEQRAERDAGAAKAGAPARTAGETLAQVKDALSAIRTVYVTSLEALRDRGFDAAEDRAAPDEKLDTGRLSRRLREALDRLPERERELLTKHYWEGKNLVEAGAELGISKSWASRLHAQAVDKLRTIVDAET